MSDNENGSVISLVSKREEIEQEGQGVPEHILAERQEAIGMLERLTEMLNEGSIDGIVAVGISRDVEDMDHIAISGSTLRTPAHTMGCIELLKIHLIRLIEEDEED